METLDPRTPFGDRMFQKMMGFCSKSGFTGDTKCCSTLDFTPMAAPEVMVAKPDKFGRGEEHQQTQTAGAEDPTVIFAEVFSQGEEKSLNDIMEKK